MSGIATSLTLGIPHELVPVMRRAFADEDDDTLLSVDQTRPYYLYGGSRNNHMESCIQEVLERFPHFGIGYLCKHHVALEGKELAQAIVDSRSFLAFLYSESDFCAEHFNKHLFTCTGKDIRDEIERLPASIEAVIADFKASDKDADNHQSLLRFLNAHAAVLEDAQANGLAAMYCIWLYGA
ncbi:MAG TPA: hypothetical protein VGH81_12665 [Rudaea sp.]|jgi:hypothetical protein